MDADVVGAVKRALAAQMEALRDEVHQLAQPLGEEQFWARPVVPGNSFGHLVLHLTGNLSHFAGARMAGTGYVRDRDREFTEAEVPPKAEALARLDEAVAVYLRVVESLSGDGLVAPHPDAEKMGSAVNALVKMLTHFALHRGQMSYLARLA
jgi:uncharacterized damage-inducible protein DinB